MAEGRYDFEYDLPAEITLSIPPFLKDRAQPNLKVNLRTHKLTSICVHVDKAIHRENVIKTLLNMG